MSLIEVSEDDLDDLRSRLARTRWPEPWPLPEWQAGTSLTELRRLVTYWRDRYDWRAKEAAINALPSFVADIDGVPVHYLRYDGGPGAVPIVLTNGWPSTFWEMVTLAERLSSDGAFTVVVPSLPGFTFSGQRPGLPPDLRTHEIWHRLMHDELGFPRYVAHGGDLGAGITARLGAAHPEEVIGLHLMAVGAPDELEDLTADEQAYLDAVANWQREEGAYAHQHSTRPMSLGVGLSDSPAGLLAWILEKYRAWSDGEGTSAFTDDFLLTQASLYWFTDTIGTSLRPYYENAGHRTLAPVSVPTAVALFPADIAHPPRSWAERTFPVVRWTVLPRGGHFAPIEQPDLLAEDIRSFVASLD